MGYLRQLGLTYQPRFNASGRAFPDVSAQGEKLLIAYRGQTISVDGTSASAPIFASIVALINDRVITKGRTPLGFLNPLIYSNPVIWNDIMTGNFAISSQHILMVPDLLF
jgi:tripeptidyl-peptidase-1